MYIYCMIFEYDQDKSESNKFKHGIDFEQAKLLWKDDNLLEIPAKTTSETRYLVIGRILEKYWSAIVTYRKQKTRIISVRRSRKEEIEIYENI